MLSDSKSLISMNCPERTLATNLCGKGSVAGDEASGGGGDTKPG